LPLEHEKVSLLPPAPLSPTLLREARAGAHRWLTRFAPLLDEAGSLSAQECRSRLDQVPELRSGGESVRSALQAQAIREDATLLDTLADALRELDGLENDLRERLGLVAPGDVASRVDLDRVRAKLAEAAARRELEEATGSSLGAPARLELNASPANMAGALFMGVFSFGWLSFTTFHAMLMIGGAAMAFGWFALALLGFYAIFFLAGFGMAAAAVRAGSSEELELEGQDLTLRRKFLLWSREHRFRLGKESRAYRAEPSMRQQGSPAMEVSIQDANGKEIRFGSNCPAMRQEQLVTRINEYLAARD
jgi:hypothetical protein